MDVETERFYILRNIISTFGEIKSKKHGNWIKLNLFNDYFLELDTWNSSILLKQGNGKYKYWTGFEGNVFKRVGIHWGNLEFNYVWVNFCLAHLGKYKI